MRWRTRARRSGWRREHRDCRAQREGDVHQRGACDRSGRHRWQGRHRATGAAWWFQWFARSRRVRGRPRRQRRCWRPRWSRSGRRFSGCTLQGHRAIARSGHDVRRRRPRRRRLRGRETSDARGYEVASAGRTARRAGRWGSGLQPPRHTSRVCRSAHLGHMAQRRQPDVPASSMPPEHFQIAGVGPTHSQLAPEADVHSWPMAPQPSKVGPQTGGATQSSWVHSHMPGATQRQSAWQSP